MGILDDIAAAKMRAVEEWVAKGARGDVHMKQVLAAEDVVIASLDDMRLLLGKDGDADSLKGRDEGELPTPPG